jgi:hypothetical protein
MHTVHVVHRPTIVVEKAIGKNVIDWSCLDELEPLYRLRGVYQGIRSLDNDTGWLPHSERARLNDGNEWTTACTPKIKIFLERSATEAI